MIFFLRCSLDWLVRIFDFEKKLVIIDNRTVLLDLKIDTRIWNIYIYCNFNTLIADQISFSINHSNSGVGPALTCDAPLLGGEGGGQAAYHKHNIMCFPGDLTYSDLYASRNQMAKPKARPSPAYPRRPRGNSSRQTEFTPRKPLFSEVSAHAVKTDISYLTGSHTLTP